MKRIAVISGIHGNLNAIKATLKQIKSAGIDEVICLGNIVGFGVHPNECVNLVKENCSVVIQGKYDKLFSNFKDSSNINRLEPEEFGYIQNLITEESRKYLSELPFCHEMYIGDKLVRFINSKPTGFVNYDYLSTSYLTMTGELHKPSKKTVSQNEADIVIHGIDNVASSCDYNNRLSIGPGSVGNSNDALKLSLIGDPINSVHADYLVLEYDQKGNLRYVFVQEPYNISNELKELYRNRTEYEEGNSPLLKSKI